MYCRNCGNEVHEKAIACLKCGVNPQSEKNFCPSCGTSTNANQVVCTKCGVSLAKQGILDVSNLQWSIQKINVQAFVQDKAKVAALIGLFGCFLPWLKINLIAMSQSISGFGISKIVDYVPNTILVSFLLYLFPLCLLGFILSDFIPQISKYKRYFSIGSALLIIYAGIGLYLAVHPSAPSSKDDVFDMMASAQRMAKNMVSIGWGYYVSLVGAMACFFLNLKS